MYYCECSVRCFEEGKCSFIISHSDNLWDMKSKEQNLFDTLLFKISIFCINIWYDLKIWLIALWNYYFFFFVHF